MKDVRFEETAFEDISFWAKNDLKLLRKIIQLIDNIQQTSFEGIGKPEALRHNLQGYWSRRIDGEHRLIYHIEDDSVIIVSCRYHY